jgi:sulfonate transport system substrate-binding protein
VVKTLGTFAVPTSWDEFIARHQETVDLLVKEQDQEPLDVESLYDRRYEEAIAEAVSENGAENGGGGS